MTPDPRSPSDSILDAVESAARALPADDPRAHVFYEDRADVRMVLASTGLREVVSSRTHGGTIAGRRSNHATDPAFLRPSGDQAEPPLGELRASKHTHADWVLGMEAKILGVGCQVMNGRPHLAWSAKLVAFHQEIWVAPAQQCGRRDIRRGCRLEIRVQPDGDLGVHAVEERVVGEGEEPILQKTFERALARAEDRRAIGGPPRRGVTSAVFAPGAAGIVAHELIGHALEADVVSDGRSWLGVNAPPTAGRSVTVTDDPRRGRGAWVLDDEGVAARDVVLIDRNRRAGVLLDRSSAEALGTASTGHGRRSSFLDVVRPRMGCTYIESGPDDPAEVLRSTHEGLFIRRLAAGHTDPAIGRATFIVTDADRIVAGRLAEPVETFVLEVNGQDAWPSIDRVAHDLTFDTCIGSCVRDGQPLAVSVGAPTIRIGVVTVRS